MVGRDGMANAIALNSAVFNLARIAGPAVAAGSGVGARGADHEESLLDQRVNHLDDVELRAARLEEDLRERAVPVHQVVDPLGERLRDHVPR